MHERHPEQRISANASTENSKNTGDVVLAAFLAPATGGAWEGRRSRGLHSFSGISIEAAVAAARAVTVDVYVCNFGENHSAKARGLMAALVRRFQPEWTEQRSLDRGSDDA